MAKNQPDSRSGKQLNMLLPFQGRSASTGASASTEKTSDQELRQRIFEQLRMSGLTRNSLP
jgi:hypothetical protein